MARIRTIQRAAAEIKENDNNTAVTEFYIRKLVGSGIVPALKSGGKFLVNMDELERYLTSVGEPNVQN